MASSVEALAGKAVQEGIDQAVFEAITGQRRIKPASHHGVKLVTFTKTITSCYHQCPFFTLDGGPGPVMLCTHPSFENDPYSGAIISHTDDIQNGFPPRCPLFQES